MLTEKKSKTLSHLDKSGKARMVDVGRKSETIRQAAAYGEISITPKLHNLLKEENISKGDVFAAAQLAGIMAAKKTSELIPLCHPLQLDVVKLSFDLQKEKVKTAAYVKSTGKTGVEMEALTAVSVALLTIYDMCKSVDKGMTISSVYLTKKSGGRSGDYERKKRISS